MHVLLIKCVRKVYLSHPGWRLRCSVRKPLKKALHMSSHHCIKEPPMRWYAAIFTGILYLLFTLCLLCTILLVIFQSTGFVQTLGWAKQGTYFLAEFWAFFLQDLCNSFSSSPTLFIITLKGITLILNIGNMKYSHG